MLFLDSEVSPSLILLVVDNDLDFVEMLTGWLQTLGYEVHRAYTGKHAMCEWEEHRPDLIILDTLVQDMDALAMCREMRSKDDALVIVVTDGKDVHDEVGCLESGAHDYLRKPFFPAQLLARIRAVSRRGRSTLTLRPSSLITIGHITVDSLHNEVTVSGKTVRLTPIESKMLHVLATNTNAICTSEHIVSHVWGLNNDGERSLIKAHISHLRQKVELDPGKPRFLLTVPGVGYTLEYRQADKRASQEMAR
jgi:DNA-binding response OmpR family regulator